MNHLFHIRHVSVLSLILFCMFSAQSQEVFSFTGYVMEFGAYSRVNSVLSTFSNTEQNQWTNITRLRLRSSAQPWEDAEIMLEYETSLMFRSAASLLQSVPAVNKRQVVDLMGSCDMGSDWMATHVVDRLYLRQSVSGIDVTLGRQRIAWGSGRIWNPTDLFNPLNPAVVSKIEKDGVDALLVKTAFGNFTDFSLVCNPQRGWKEVNTGARFRTNVEEVDVVIMGGRFDRRCVIGLDAAGSLFDAGIRAEGIYSWDPREQHRAFASWIVGTDYQFTSDAYAMIEYHWNGEGTSDRARYEMPRLASGEILSLGQQYFAAQGSYLVHPLIALNAMSMRNLNDGSGFTSASATYAVTDEIALAAGLQFFDGTSASEFWWYPDIAYLRADVWF